MKTINNQKYVWRKTIRTVTVVKFSVHLVSTVHMEAIKPELDQFDCSHLKQQEHLFSISNKFAHPKWLNAGARVFVAVPKSYFNEPISMVSYPFQSHS